jgi:hypothetical protein
MEATQTSDVSESESERFIMDQDVLKFSDGRCYVGEIVSLEAPLEAFGQCKLTSAFGELNHSTVLAVAAQLGFEVLDGMPYDEIRWMANYHLQRCWFEQIPGGVPKHVQQNYEERLAHYQATLAKVKRGEVMTGEQVTEAGTKTTKAAKAPREPKVNKTYTYAMTTNTLPERVTKGVANEQTTNHDFIIAAILMKEKEPVSLETITRHVENTGRYETKDPLPKSVRWHLAKMEKEGVVIAHAVSTPSVETVAVAPKATHIAKPVKGNATPKAAQATAAPAKA